MDTGALAESIGEGTATSRGCVASALLTSDGTLLSSVPEGVAFPAAALSAVQKATAADPAASFQVLSVGSHQVEVLRLESGQYLVNLLLPPEPVSGISERPPARVRVRVEPVVTADWQEGALPAAEPTPLLPPEEPAPLLPAEEPAPPMEPEEPEVPLSSLLEASRAAAAEEPVGETVQALRSQLVSPSSRPEAETRVVTPSPSLPTRGREKEGPPTRVREKGISPSPEDASNARVALKRRSRGPAGPPHTGGGTYPSRGLVQAILVTFIVIVLAALWPLSPLPQLVVSGGPAPSPSPSAKLSPLPSSSGSTVVPTPSPSSAPSPVPLTFTRVLGQGVSGPDVAALQERLRQLGYFTYPQDTGYFGVATYGAVFTFQHVRLLPTTGAADARTVEELNDCDQSCANPLSAR